MFGPSKRDLLRLVEQERKQHRAELQNLLDRLADKNGRPWTPAPADVKNTDDSVEQQPWTPAPEQEPIL